jgi:ATP-binding cassette subfamily B protein
MAELKRKEIIVPVGPGRRGPVEKVRAKNTTGTARRLWQYLRRDTIGLVGVIVFVAITCLFGLLGPYLIGKAIDNYMSTGDLPGLGRTALMLLGVYVVTALSAWLQTFLMAPVAQTAVMELRKDLFEQLQSLSLRFFDKHPHGDLMSRISNDIDIVSNVLNESVVQFITALITIVGVGIVMLFLNPWMALVTLVTLPLLVFVTKQISKHTRKGYQDQQKALGELNGLIEETISGSKIVKAYGREESAIADFEESNETLKKAAIRAQTFMIIPGPIGNFLNNMSFAIIATTGGLFVVSGIATVGNIASFIAYSREFNRPLNQLANLYNTVQSAIAAAERVFELIDEVPELVDSENAEILPPIAGDVVFDDVSFGYEKEQPVLKNVSLHAKPGQTVAFVGPTGAGKTTVVNLLTRFYDIDSGQITIDGHDIKQVQKDSLRSQLGIVLQDTYLFTESVLENIRYGRLEASDEEVIAAAKLADADGFIMRLPQAYNTQLSERGGNLSQGQRQLLAIARAILADPGILILDEATSSVDTRTEIKIQQALLRLMEGRTSFVIAHRLSTIREADQVLVINDGRVIERGNHLQLLEQKGFYYNLYMSQFKGQVETETLIGTPLLD